MDSLLELAERVGILLVAYAAFQLFFGANDPAETRPGKVLALINDNWRAALLVVLPVFYRSLRMLFRRVRQVTAAGIGLTFADTGEEPSREAPPEQEPRE